MWRGRYFFAVELRQGQFFFNSNQNGADTFFKSKNGFALAWGYNKFCLVPKPTFQCKSLVFIFDFEQYVTAA